MAGLPEGEDVFEAGEQAGEAGQDQDVQRRDHPGADGVVVGLSVHAGTDAGDLLGQGRVRN
ncbi:MAG: hypothetical protein IT555_08025 [Acetobacteraceae bacterium]|nr:hypothetical protein [Acetobacteraceae bacterium]